MPEQDQKYNPSLNAFITITADEARAAARRMQEEQRRGIWRGPLHGIPIAVKDNIDTAVLVRQPQASYSKIGCPRRTRMSCAG